MHWPADFTNSTLAFLTNTRHWWATVLCSRPAETSKWGRVQDRDLSLLSVSIRLRDGLSSYCCFRLLLMHEFLKLEGVQHMPPPNIPLWHIDSFRLKTLKNEHMQDGLADLPFSTQKQVMQFSLRKALLATGRTAHSNQCQMKLCKHTCCNDPDLPWTPSRAPRCCPTVDCPSLSPFLLWHPQNLPFFV